MRFFRPCILLILFAFLASAGWAKTSHSKKPVHSSSKTSRGKKATAKQKKASAKHKKGSWKNRGQKTIADDRTREIQEALIRAHYLDAEPTGVMDARTKAALTKLQGDNGWQTKIVPDSRALIKLGLGPSHENLLNPDTAAVATTGTVKPGGDPAFQPQR